MLGIRQFRVTRMGMSEMRGMVGLRPVFQASDYLLNGKNPVSPRAVCNGDPMPWRHRAPFDNCDCGYYAHVRIPERWEPAPPLFLTIVLVDGFGKLVLHRTGWRAEFMKVLALVGNGDSYPILAEDLRLPVVTWEAAASLLAQDLIRVQREHLGGVGLREYTGPRELAGIDEIAPVPWPYVYGYLKKAWQVPTKFLVPHASARADADDPGTAPDQEEEKKAT